MAYNYGNFQNGGYSYSGQTYNTAVPNMNQIQTQLQYPYNQQSTYQNQMPQMQQPQQNQPIGNAGFVWVQGEAGAKAYPVAAGNSVLLMDSENPVLYMKSTDSSGKPLPIETYDLVKRVNASYQMPPAQAPKAPEIDLSEYVKSSELEAKVMELIDKALGK